MDKIEYFVTEFHGPDGPCRGTLADLVLDAHFVQRCGFIPPFRVLRSLLRRGMSGGGMSPGCEWQPFELTEDDYSEVIQQLERLTPDDLKFDIATRRLSERFGPTTMGRTPMITTCGQIH